MTKLQQAFSVIAVTFCLTTFAQTAQNNIKPASGKKSLPVKQTGTAYWINDFKQFREALFQGDKTKAKAFFDFPIKNEGNEIWYLVYDQNEKAIDKLRDITKPFTEADFDRYFNKIFPKNFVRALLKIKADELYKQKTYQTAEIRDSLTAYILYSTFDKLKNLLELNFASRTEYKDEKGEPLDGGESNIIYYFKVTKQGQLKFKQIKIAG